MSNERHPHAQRGEHAGVLEADHPGADHHERARQTVEAHRVVAREDAPSVEHDALVARGRGAGGQNDVRPADGLSAVAVGVLDLDGVRIDEGPVAVEDVDVVAQQLMPHDVGLVAHHLVGPEDQILHADVLLGGVRRSVEAAVAVARQGHRGLAQGLGRDGAGPHADAPDPRGALDHRDLLAQLGRLDGRALTTRARPDRDQVVVEGRTVHGDSIGHRGDDRSAGVVRRTVSPGPSSTPSLWTGVQAAQPPQVSLRSRSMKRISVSPTVSRLAAETLSSLSARLWK